MDISENSVYWLWDCRGSNIRSIIPGKLEKFKNLSVLDLRNQLGRFDCESLKHVRDGILVKSDCIWRTTTTFQDNKTNSDYTEESMSSQGATGGYFSTLEPTPNYVEPSLLWKEFILGIALIFVIVCVGVLTGGIWIYRRRRYGSVDPGFQNNAIYSPNMTLHMNSFEDTRILSYGAGNGRNRVRRYTDEAV